MIRNSFNGGELAPRFRVRADLDAFQRGASRIENFDVGQEGGLSRRRGFVPFCSAQSVDSRLFGYRYRNDERYLIEVGIDHIRIYDVEGALVDEEASPYSSAQLEGMRCLQINSLLLLLCDSAPVHQLTCDAAGNWDLGLFEFAVPPWRHLNARDREISLARRSDGNYDITFDEDEDIQESTPAAGELLRASYYTPTQRLWGTQLGYFTSITSHHEEGFISASSSISQGHVLAVRRQPEYAIYACTADWTGSSMFIDGLDSPVNYPSNFALSTDQTAFTFSVSELSAGFSCLKGQGVRLAQGYWDIYTCIKAFDGATHFQTGATNPEDYAGHFTPGIMIGEAPCKGKWNLCTAGTWFGRYEIRASYEGGGITAPWEYRAEATSPNIAPCNTPVGGDESSEECMVSLWFTRARAYGTTWSARNFPTDSCGNQLTVETYKHDMTLEYKAEGYYVRKDRIPTEWSGAMSTADWSWSAFAEKYGFPRLASVFNQRLVFAGTVAQPQTVWLSRTDDINNFDAVQLDDGAMALTMSSQSQDPIRWLASQNSRIMLGTADGEYIIQSGSSSSVMTATNAAVAVHGFTGAADINHLQCNDQLIYFERGAGRAYSYGYDFAADAYKSTDLTIFADHILSEGCGVKDGCFLRKPHTKAVMVLHDGSIAVMTYNSMHQINAWHRYTTAGLFKACCMLPNGNESDSLFVVTERNGEAYIEYQNESNEYLDGGQHDYTSLCVSNTLQSVALGGHKSIRPQIQLYFLEPTLAEGVEISVDAGGEDSFRRPARIPSKMIESGWVGFTSVSSALSEVCVAFRVRGNRSFTVLALQA